jgi:hypothetical protein
MNLFDRDSAHTHIKRIRLERMGFGDQDVLMYFPSYLQNMAQIGTPVQKLHLVACSDVTPSLIEKIRGSVWSLEIDDPEFEQSHRRARCVSYCRSQHHR